MLMEEFTRDLPTETECDKCGSPFTALEWYVTRSGAADWMGICPVSCLKCSWTKIAAAGSSLRAHREAQKARQKLVWAMAENDKKIKR